MIKICPLINVIIYFSLQIREITGKKTDPALLLGLWDTAAWNDEAANPRAEPSQSSVWPDGCRPRSPP